MNTYSRKLLRTILICGIVCGCAAAFVTRAEGNYEVFVTNEKSGDVTVIDGATQKAVATFPVGKRPRGIHVSPDGKTIYVAVSGTPISAPPQLDANGNPIFKRGKDDDDDDNVKSDKSADGIAVVDVQQRKFLRKLPAGSDPEQFAVSADGKELYISNEDVGTASALNISSEKVEHIIPVHKEPEGVGLNPDGKTFFVTCENDGEIFVVSRDNYKVIAHFNVGGRLAPWTSRRMVRRRSFLRNPPD